VVASDGWRGALTGLVVDTLSVEEEAEEEEEESRSAAFFQGSIGLLSPLDTSGDPRPVSRCEYDSSLSCLYARDGVGDLEEPRLRVDRVDSRRERFSSSFEFSLGCAESMSTDDDRLSGLFLVSAQLWYPEKSKFTSAPAAFFPMMRVLR
jgi:hypothetical protein